MKKYFLFLIILTITISISYCSSTKIGTMEGQSYTTQGWIDDNTFRIAARGAYPDEEDNPIVKEEMAKRAAILNAQYQILEKFVGAQVKGAAGMKDFRTNGIAVSQEIEGVIRGGAVFKETYNDYGCEVIFEVKAKGLRNKVKATQIKAGQEGGGTANQ